MAQDLPDGWEIRFTDDGTPYYIDHINKRSTYDDPRVNNSATNSSNNSTKNNVAPTTQALPQGWEQKTDPEGNIYYVNHVNKTSTYDDPRETKSVDKKEEINPSSQKTLPEGWECRLDAEGTPYYIDHVNRKSTYDFPTDSKRLVKSSSTDLSSPRTLQTSPRTSSNMSPVPKNRPNPTSGATSMPNLIPNPNSSISAVKPLQNTNQSANQPTNQNTRVVGKVNSSSFLQQPTNATPASQNQPPVKGHVRNKSAQFANSSSQQSTPSPPVQPLNPGTTQNQASRAKINPPAMIQFQLPMGTVQPQLPQAGPVQNGKPNQVQLPPPPPQSLQAPPPPLASVERAKANPPQMIQFQLPPPQSALQPQPKVNPPSNIQPIAQPQPQQPKANPPSNTQPIQKPSSPPPTGGEPRKVPNIIQFQPPPPSLVVPPSAPPPSQSQTQNQASRAKFNPPGIIQFQLPLAQPVQQQAQQPIVTSPSSSAGSSSPLPSGWEMRLDNNNQPYFIDHSNKRSTYDDPRLNTTETPRAEVQPGSGPNSARESTTIIDTSMPGVLKTGFMFKQGGKVKTWKKRFFILKSDCLVYYEIAPEKGKPMPTAKGRFDLLGSHELDSVSNPIEGKFLITVKTPKRDFKMTTSSEQELKDWLEALKGVLAKLKTSSGSFLNVQPSPAKLNKKAEKKNSINKMTVFGIVLDDVMNNQRAELSFAHLTIPAILHAAIEYLNNPEILKQEGLFRLSGSLTTIQEYKSIVDKGGLPEFNNLTDPHAVAGLLKLYIRELPEPLLTFDQSRNALDLQLRANKGEAGYLEKLGQLLRSLPSDNFASLKALFLLLSQVWQYSTSNKMTSSNLAIVFGPNLIKVKDEDSLTAIENSPLTSDLTKTMIEQCQYLFA